MSDPLGYECKRLKLPVAVLTERFCEGMKDAESMLPLRPISDIWGGRLPLAGMAGGGRSVVS